MNLLQNRFYQEDIDWVANLDIPWILLKDKTILISGANGLIASFLIDVLMKKNDSGLNCKVVGIGRNSEKAKKRFSQYLSGTMFSFVSQDINEKIEFNISADYVLHLASNTHPVAYSTDPIGTITTNVIGSYNMLMFAAEHNAKRFLFSSSNEIYGENRGDVEFFDESYCGYIASNSLRAGYPESKRCGEALCQAFMHQKGLDVVIARLTRSYGPTLLSSDTKAMTQFLRNGINGDDIVLKSEGKQHFSYSYVSDSVAGLLYTLLLGKNGEAYNIADKKGDSTLKEIAESIAGYCGSKVVFNLPNEIEKAGFSKASKARLSGDKLKQLGWGMKYNINDGIKRTLDILRSA